MGSPLSNFVPHTVEVLLNSHHTQHFSGSCLTYHEVFSLTAPHITLLYCNNLNPGTLLPSVTNEAPHDYLTLMDHLLTPPYYDLQEISLGNADFMVH